eukprot:TRINITY_DN70875_c0_g1_i1.p1 TRINITY_DN70875_c0_g1~~TRINITY_DN70875_c0_g1_i1.p1  ORF type:complete len:185 (-),score=1.96 TRINITY_DN70875_c0_g1_i1:770-1291(-)
MYQSIYIGQICRSHTKYVDRLTDMDSGDMIHARANSINNFAYDSYSYVVQRFQAGIENWLMESCEESYIHMNTDIISSQLNEIKVTGWEQYFGYSVSKYEYSAEYNNQTKQKVANAGGREGISNILLLNQGFNRFLVLVYPVTTQQSNSFFTYQSWLQLIKYNIIYTCINYIV